MKTVSVWTKMFRKLWTKPKSTKLHDSDVMSAVTPEPTPWRPVDPHHSGHLLR